MNRKILVVLAVFAVALAVVTVSIEAQRGGGSRGGGSGGSGGGMHPESNVNDNTNGNGNINGNFPPGNYDVPAGDCSNYNGNYELPPGNYGPGNYEALGVCVYTDKRTYAEGEPIGIEVKAYNPLDSVITLEFRVGSPDEVGCQAYYTIDAVLPFNPTFVPCNDVVDNIPIPSGGSYSWLFTHTESVFPGSYSVAGVIHSAVGGVIYGQSAPTTIDVVAETPVLASGPSAILLKSRRFVPEPGIDQAFEAELLASEEEAVHVLLQLYHAPTDAERRLLEENNVRLLAYIPNNAWFVSIPPKNVTLIVTLPEVRWVGEILPGDKISPEIRDGVDSWAINEDGTVNLIIQFFKDVSLDDAIQIISNYGGITDGRASSSNVMNIIVPNEAIIPYLATEDSVQWIEEPYPIESYE